MRKSIVISMLLHLAMWAVSQNTVIVENVSMIENLETNICLNTDELNSSLFTVAISELKRREGFRSMPYHGPEGGKLWYIGWGTRITSAEAAYYRKVGGISYTDASKRLYSKFQYYYDRVVQEWPQYDKNVHLALADLSFNCGFWKVHNSRLGKMLDNNQLHDAAENILSWHYYRRSGRVIKSKNLLKSRHVNRAMMLGHWCWLNNYIFSLKTVEDEKKS